MVIQVVSSSYRNTFFQRVVANSSLGKRSIWRALHYTDKEPPEDWRRGDREESGQILEVLVLASISCSSSRFGVFVFCLAVDVCMVKKLIDSNC
jgi:hypothetical protein